MTEESNQTDLNEVQQVYSYISPVVQYKGYTYLIKGNERYHYCIIVDGKEKCSPEWVDTQEMAHALALVAIDKMSNVIPFPGTTRLAEAMVPVNVAQDEDW